MFVYIIGVVGDIDTMRKKMFIPVDMALAGVLFHGVLTMVMQQSMTRKLPWFLVPVAYLALMAVTVRLQPFST